MKRLLKWWKAEPEIKTREPVVPQTVVEQAVTLESVEPAQLPENPAIKAAQGDLVQALLKLGRRSHDLRIATTDVALASVTGGRGR